ncbi:hypothetical protein NE237_031820 [Protea cynaroides]|uniref:Gnk2-homologous domain-containing protein n=1 Tax=Protea cynaroides TaxID=273540 RepID=A0A9Q0R2I6_9MAGN|nr:hypothetical protein NE237_031820 [Protea cynaroides]
MTLLSLAVLIFLLIESRDKEIAWWSWKIGETMDSFMATISRTQSVFLFFFLALSSLLTFCICTDPVYLYHVCSSKTLYASNSTYQSNLNTLLSSLSNSKNTYNKATVGGQSSNAVHGFYYCRGDVTSDMCSDCIKTAAQEITHRCPNRKIGYIWYDECMLHYSNYSTSVSDSPLFFMWNTQNISDATRFNQLLGDNINKVATAAASNSKRFATKKANFTPFQNLYCLAQCSPNLSGNDCNRCLVRTIAYLPNCCIGKQGGRVLNPSCNIRFEVYPFYKVTASPAGNSSTTVPGDLLQL